MSLRDYFASHAPDYPGGWAASAAKKREAIIGTTASLREYAEAVAEWRFIYAEAMLAERGEARWVTVFAMQFAAPSVWSLL